MVNRQAAPRVARVLELVFGVLGPGLGERVLVERLPQVLIGGNAFGENRQRVDAGLGLIGPERRFTETAAAERDSVQEDTGQQTPARAPSRHPHGRPPFSGHGRFTLLAHPDEATARAETVARVYGSSAGNRGENRQSLRLWPICVGCRGDAASAVKRRTIVLTACHSTRPRQPRRALDNAPPRGRQFAGEIAGRSTDREALWIDRQITSSIARSPPQEITRWESSSTPCLFPPSSRSAT